jgi:hypothetical protein
MVLYDAPHNLLDEAFFPTRIEEAEKGKPLRRGSGTYHHIE